MDEKEIYEMLSEIDDTAQLENQFDYGLPLYGKPMAEMIEIVKRYVNK